MTIVNDTFPSSMSPWTVGVGDPSWQSAGVVQLTGDDILERATSGSYVISTTIKMFAIGDRSGFSPYGNSVTSPKYSPGIYLNTAGTQFNLCGARYGGAAPSSFGLWTNTPITVIGGDLKIDVVIYVKATSQDICAIATYHGTSYSTGLVNISGGYNILTYNKFQFFTNNSPNLTGSATGSTPIFSIGPVTLTYSLSDADIDALLSPQSSFSISSTSIKVKPFPTYEIKPAYSFIQNSSGYWKGVDRGAAQDVYIGNFTAEAVDADLNTLQTTINSSRESITFSGFNTDLLAPNVDQSGSVVGTILDFGARKQLQFNGIGQSVFYINISFRALSPSILSTTPSLAKLRLVENWLDMHTTEIAKGQSLTQSYSYSDRNSDAGRFVGNFSQTRAETQAILAYILTTARAASFTFPTLSGVGYPFGISKGTGPFTVIIYDFKVTRQNLNRWTIMIDFRESV